MIDGAYISEAIDPKDFEENSLNIVEAPCGSGKSYFARQLPERMGIERGRTLMLCDTRNLKNGLSKMNNMIASDEWYKMFLKANMEDEFVNPDSFIKVMTYYTFGKRLIRDKAALKGIKLIICDEFHNAFKFREFSEESRPKYEKAIDTIQKRSQLASTMVVALTATPNAVIEGFNDEEIPYKVIKPKVPIRQFEEKTERHYRNIANELAQIKQGEKVLLYVQRVTKMKECKRILTDRGIPCETLWSIYYKDPMDEHQQAVLRHLVEKETLHPDIDVLIVNASCGTGINIRSDKDTGNPKDKVNKIIIHSTDGDEMIQARGRYRDDVDLFMTPKETHIDHEDISAWLGKRLFEEEKEALCQKLGFRDKSHRLYKFLTIKKYLIESGYHVDDRKREGNRHYAIIEAPNHD
jgi:DNA or RNA helicases of superfamily II